MRIVFPTNLTAQEHRIFSQSSTQLSLLNIGLPLVKFNRKYRKPGYEQLVLFYYVRNWNYGSWHRASICNFRLILRFNMPLDDQICDMGLKPYSKHSTNYWLFIYYVDWGLRCLVCLLQTSSDCAAVIYELTLDLSAHPSSGRAVDPYCPLIIQRLPDPLICVKLLFLFYCHLYSSPSFVLRMKVKVPDWGETTNDDWM